MNKEVRMTWFLIFFSLSLLTACSDSNLQSRQSNARNRLNPSSSIESIVGTIENVDSQIILMSEVNDYKISGIDLSQKVGKKVKLTGTITESEGQFTLTVHNYKEIDFDDN